jgi:hypothetical protein
VAGFLFNYIVSVSMKYKVIRPPLTARFHLPTKDELFRTSTGDFVKVMFQVADDTVERMWVVLQECFDSDKWAGILDNDPYGEKNGKVLRAGMKVEFHPYDIIDIVRDGSPEMEKLVESKQVSDREDTKPWWKKPEVIIPIVIAIISIPWLPTLYQSYLQPLLLDTEKVTGALSDVPEGLATSTMNIISILDKNFTFTTAFEKSKFIENYRDTAVYGRGTFRDLSVAGTTYYLYLTVGRYPVACSFESPDKELENKLISFIKGSSSSFLGKFTGHGLWDDGSWVVDNCILIN